MSQSNLRCPQCGAILPVGAANCPHCTPQFPTLLQAGPRTSPDPSRQFNFWKAVSAVQRSILILILGAAVYLLYRHEMHAAPLLAPGAVDTVDYTAPTVIESPYRHATVFIDPPTLMIPMGRTGMLRTRSGSPRGDLGELPPSLFDWTSSNPGIVYVQDGGRFFGAAVGQTTVTAHFKDGHASASANIIVTGPPGAMSVLQGRPVLQTLIPLQDPGYRYLLAPVGRGIDPTEASYSGSQFAGAAGGFGSGQSGCVTNGGYVPQTFWPLNEALLVRHNFTAPIGIQGVMVGLSLNGTAEVFINGSAIYSGPIEHSGCPDPSLQWIQVTNGVVRPGNQNWISVHLLPGRDAAYFDMKVTGLAPQS